MILAYIIITLLIGGLLCWLIGRWNPHLVKWIALLTVLIDLALTSTLWFLLKSLPISGTWLLDYQVNWIPNFGISFHLALDGLSLVMLVLTFFLGTLAVLCSW